MRTFDEAPIGHRKDGSPIYDNAATVVCPVVTTADGRLVIVRRARDPGKGLLALPAGFQMRGETWKECGAREVHEETGYQIRVKDALVAPLHTDAYGHNLIFPKALAMFSPEPEWERPAEEIIEVLLAHPSDDLELSEWAFPLHFFAACRWQGQTKRNPGFVPLI